MRAALLLSILVGTSLSSLAFADESSTLVLDKPETAGICGFRAMWDMPIVTAADGVRIVKDDVIKDRGGTADWWTGARDKGTKPGAIAFDALRRFLLVRFPGAAEKIAAKVDEGNAIEKVELVLPFKDEELWPEGSSGGGVGPEGGYEYRANWGVDTLYRQHRPTWHAMAWALRKPWAADAETGPTFNAWLNGAGYWKKYGAQDTDEDRFPKAFGPTPVNYKSPEGRMDVTSLVTDTAFGKTLGERLRVLADSGFVLQKWETYDHRYYNGCYEWATATGGRAIVIDAPKLIVTLKKGAAEKVGLPPAADPKALAASLKQGGKGGKPSAVMPTNAELEALAKRYAFARPDWMPAWQWERVKTLLTVERGDKAVDEPFWMPFAPKYLVDRRVGAESADKSRPARPRGEIAYDVMVDSMLARAPRGWNGFEASEVLLPYQLYRDALPGPARDTYLEYWTAWLMPDRATAPREKHQDPDWLDGTLVHPMVDQLKKVQATTSFSGGDTYFNKTGDWRGNKSFYRSGFCYTMSTMNFNHTSAMGALLGGALIGSDAAMADGRYGIENYPLRLWCWFDGTTQESIDHYYLSITLTAQKMIADYGPTPFDRLMGRSILLKTMDELIGAYHPGLHRFVSGSSRTAPNHLLVTQDGVYHILHTLSREGVLRDLDTKDAPGGLPVIGQELAPDHVGRQTLQGPWAPEWESTLVDSKPLPWEMTCTFKQWGGHVEIPIMRRTYMGRHYGLYSSDAQMGIVPILGQWRRTDKPAAHMQDVATMLVRYGVNTTRLVNDAPGWMATYGDQSTLQHKGKMIVVTSPHAWLDLKKGVRSLQSTIALYNFESPKPTWEIFIDGRPAGALPVKAKAAGRITIHDGVSYLGVLPLPATDLGRDAEVVLSEGDTQEFEHRTYKAALVIDNYNLKKDASLPEGTDQKPIDRAYGGFVVEMADATEYPTFDEFQKHIAAATLEAKVDADKALAEVKYASGKDTLELGAYTTYKEGDKLDKCFAYRRVNGEWPYLPKGIERDSSFAQQGTTGRLAKNGATLRSEPGRMVYLQAWPPAGVFAGYNPLPDPTAWELEVPGGIRVSADGKVGMAHVTVQPKERRVTVDYAVRPTDAGKEEMAAALLLFGMKDAAVRLNGQAFDGKLKSVKTADGDALVIPLGKDVPADEKLNARYEAAKALLH